MMIFSFNSSSGLWLGKQQKEEAKRLKILISSESLNRSQLLGPANVEKEISTSW